MRTTSFTARACGILAAFVIVYVCSASGCAEQGPCLLFVHWNAITPPADEVEIFVNDASIAAFRPGDVRKGHPGRLTFEGGGKMHFVFEFRREGELLYRPEFDIALKPGALLNAQFRPYDPEAPRRRRMGPPPTKDFPSLAEGVPPRIQCWFYPAELNTDYMHVILRRAADAEAFKKDVTAKGYRIVKQTREDIFRVAPPEGMTIVEGTLEIEQWPTVRGVQFEPTVVY